MKLIKRKFVLHITKHFQPSSKSANRELITIVKEILMDYNPQVVSQSDFEEACDQIIIAIGKLKRSLRPQEPAAPAEAPPKKTRAKKAEPVPQPLPVAVIEPSPEAHASFKKTIVAYATKHGKTASLDKLKSMGFSVFADVLPQSYDAVAAAFKE